MRLERSQAALADQDDIWWYVASDSEAMADKLIERLVSAVERLADFPYMGVAREDLAAGLRALSIDNYVAFYRVLSDVVMIERVLHARMNATRKAF